VVLSLFLQLGISFKFLEKKTEQEDRSLSHMIIACTCLASPHYSQATLNFAATKKRCQRRCRGTICRRETSVVQVKAALQPGPTCHFGSNFNLVSQAPPDSPCFLLLAAACARQPNSRLPGELWKPRR
jgi:hypothetical protein